MAKESLGRGREREGGGSQASRGGGLFGCPVGSFGYREVAPRTPAEGQQPSRSEVPKREEKKKQQWQTGGAWPGCQPGPGHLGGRRVLLVLAFSSWPWLLQVSLVLEQALAGSEKSSLI